MSFAKPFIPDNASMSSRLSCGTFVCCKVFSISPSFADILSDPAPGLFTNLSNSSRFLDKSLDPTNSFSSSIFEEISEDELVESFTNALSSKNGSGRLASISALTSILFHTSEVSLETAPASFPIFIMSATLTPDRSTFKLPTISLNAFCAV